MNQGPSSTFGYPQIGEVLDGKYQIEKMLGEGGMGAVAKATHLLRRAPVALKFMNPMFTVVPGAVERFHNECVAASQIESDHVVKIWDVCTLPSGAPYLVMEYLEGLDLADLLHRDGRPGLPIERAIHFTLQILRGLQAAHAVGIIHRDMKPSNCFIVQKDGEDDFVKLVDFGISKVKQPGGGSLTQTNSALGTPLYMSPEQAKSPRDVDGRTDIYSCGVILYELLTGKTPFFSESGEFTEILFKLFTAEPPHVKSLRPDLPEGLAATVHHALSREPGNRFPDAGSFAEALAPYAGPQSAHVLQRMRNFGVPSAMRKPVGSAPDAKVSLRPPAPSGMPPGALDTGVNQAEVLAKTMGAQTPQTGDVIPKAPLLPGASTDLGATRDTGAGVQPAKKSGGTAFLAVGGVAAALAVVGGLAFAMRAGPKPTATPVQPTSDPSFVSPPPPPSVPLALPSAPVTPAPSAPPPAADASAPKPTPNVAVTPVPQPRNPPCIPSPSKPCFKTE